MTSQEVVLQIDLFTGDLVDARTSYQKKKDWERSSPPQLQMFSTPDMVQFGVRPKSAYRDWIDQTTISPMILEVEDKRTPEEIECDLVREAEKQTIPLFADTPVPSISEVETPPIPHPPTLSCVIFDAQAYFGLRACLRAKSISVRSRITRQLPRTIAVA